MPPVANEFNDFRPINRARVSVREPTETDMIFDVDFDNEVPWP